jgi:hypothetical protein
MISESNDPHRSLPQKAIMNPSARFEHPKDVIAADNLAAQQTTIGVAPVTLSGDKARQGVTGHNVRYVLAYGLIGAILTFILVGLYLSRH